MSSGGTIIKIHDIVNYIDTNEEVVEIIEVADFGSASDKIPASLATEEGQMLVSLSPGVFTAIDPPTADGQVLTADLLQPGLVEFSTPSASGVITLLNNGAGDAVSGDVAILDTSADSAMKKTTTAQDPLVVCVLLENIPAGTSGLCAISGTRVVNVQGNVTRGNWLVTSTTSGKAADGGSTKPLYGAIGRALTAYAGGGAGTVVALLELIPESMPPVLTTKGDILAASADKTPVRVAVGGVGQVIHPLSTATPGVAWQANSGGVLISRSVLGVAGAFSFTGIPATYKHLLLRGYQLQSNNASANVPLRLRYNNDTGNNYQFFEVTFQGASVAVATQGGQSSIFWRYAIPGSTYNTEWAVCEILISDYAQATNFITSFGQSGTPYGNTGAGLVWGKWVAAVKAAINRVDVSPGSGNFVAGGVMELFGIPV